MKSLCLTFALGLGFPAAFAADADLLRCLAIADSPPRLACYDDLATAMRDNKAMQASTIAPVVAIHAADPAGQNFGRPTATLTPTPTVLESRVDGRIDGWQPGTRIRLANGQVWQVGDGSVAFAALDSPIVHISPGMFGSYFLAVEGLSFQVRVKRLQ